MMEHFQLNKKIKYFGVGEYGSTTSRPHYHAIIYGLSPSELSKISTFVYLRDSKGSSVYTDNIWKKGEVTIGYDTSQSVIRYVAKYINKKVYGKLNNEFYKDRQPPFQLNSQGLGLAAAQADAESIKKNCILTDLDSNFQSLNTIVKNSALKPKIILK